jgi:hypothetical protein
MNVRRVVGWGCALGAGALLYSAAPAHGQGVPTWAPHVAERPDAGSTAGGSGSSPANVARARIPFRRDAGPQQPLQTDRWYTEPLEFFLGFNPLEPSPEELARKADGGTQAASKATPARVPEAPAAAEADGGRPVGPSGGPSVGTADGG